MADKIKLQEKPVRRVQNGRVYRQIFDAQAQLAKSVKEQASHKGMSVSEPPPSVRDGIPVVKEAAGERLGGMLTERQRTWIDGETNDPYTENPVFHRQVAELVTYQAMDDKGSHTDGHAVQALPDVVLPAKRGSDIIDRIAEGRRQRHEAAVEDMYQELAVVSADLEPRVSECGDRLMGKMCQNDAEIARLWARVEDDQNLLCMEREDLFNVWMEIQDQSSVRREGIEQLDTHLDLIEVDRAQVLRVIFASYSENLGKIAHLPSSDLQRFLDDESQSVNQAILSNRRGYSDLYARLMILDIEREKRQYSAWCRRVDDWRRLQTQLMMEKFKEFMFSDVITKPGGVENILLLMRTDLQNLNDKRLELIKSLGDFRPPQSTKPSVYEWNQQILEVTKNMEDMCRHYIQELHTEYERVCEVALDRVEALKNEIREKGVCTEQQAKLVVNDYCIPIIGERQKICEENLEKIDHKFDEINETLMEGMKSLFKFAQGAAHVWDVHEVGMARLERTLQEELEDARGCHDNQNHDKEVQLDICMDRMRQNATEPALREDLKKAMDMLDKIKHTYHAFYEEQTNLVSAYPEMVQQELVSYDESVCKFFNVDRSKGTSKEEADQEDGGGHSQSAEKHDKTKSKEKISDHGASTPDLASAVLPSAVAEILSTAHGTTFYVLTEAGEHGIPLDLPAPDNPLDEEEPPQADNGVFLTETTETPSIVDDQLECIKVNFKEFNEIKKEIRMNFLDHLDSWEELSMDAARNTLTNKTEEMHSELDLRLHLHQPRPRRAEMDIHNVRAAELIMHSERVTRHCKGVNQALTELKQRFDEMAQEHENLLAKYREGIEALETVFINANKSTKLVSLSNRLLDDQEKFMSNVRQSLRTFRQHIDDNLQSLRTSNAYFLKSFKLFSDGGNFCPEEIEDYRKRLEKMAQIIDTAEGALFEDLEGMESKRMEQSTKITHEFEDRFKNHMVDLVFIEKITRWMTNTQVKIKAEVAFSNSMAGKIVEYLQQLERRTDACIRPSFDKEKITSGELYDSLKDIFEAFNDRSLYLDCVIDPKVVPEVPLQGPPATAVTRVGFTSDVTPVSKAGMKSGVVDDPSVNIIKNILKSQKVTKLKAGFDAEDKQPNSETDAKTTRSYGTSRTPTDNPGGGRQSSLGAGDKSTKSFVKQSRAGGASSSQEKRAQSGGRRGMNSKGRLDKKYQIFGDEEESEDLPNHFLAKIKKVCRDALDGLLMSAETYYRHKGSRPVTRPDILQEAFEPCADKIVQRLQSYYNQADEYHNSCLQESRSYLEKYEQLVTHIPPLVINDITKVHFDRVEAALVVLDRKFNQEQKGFERMKQEHHTLLRPNLGHPQMAKDLMALVDREDERTRNYLKRVDEYTQQCLESVSRHAAEYISELAKNCEKVLLDFDSLMIADDIQRGRVSLTKYPTSELLRRKNAGESLTDDEVKQPATRQKKTWNGVLKNELYIGEKPQKLVRTASVTTAKVTRGHTSAQEAKEKAYKEYKSRFQELLRRISGQQDSLMTDEERWRDNWLTWVAKVKMLY